MATRGDRPIDSFGSPLSRERRASGRGVGAAARVSTSRSRSRRCSLSSAPETRRLSRRGYLRAPLSRGAEQGHPAESAALRRHRDRAIGRGTRGSRWLAGRRASRRDAEGCESTRGSSPVAVACERAGSARARPRAARRQKRRRPPAGAGGGLSVTADELDVRPSAGAIRVSSPREPRDARWALRERAGRRACDGARRECARRRPHGAKKRMGRSTFSDISPA